MPYRSERRGTALEGRKGGVVADMVRQFADPYAFLRELVQNGLDAGARELEVRVEWEPGGLSTTSVSDDGCGMTRDIVSGSLLVLFASTKEGQPGMIGKYGVGFVSVFALEPAEVTVRTFRAEGSWLLRLFPDHRYELSTGEPRGGSGTVVSLLKRMEREAFSEHARRVRAALVRWCRHAPRPVRLVVAPGGEPAHIERIDRPLGVRACLGVEVRETGARYVVGPAEGAPPPEAEPLGLEEALSPGSAFGGFYRGGLTLHETADPLPGLEGLRFKVDSPALAHTLSRDDVRRDGAFEAAVARVSAIARRELRASLEEALAAEARRVADGGDPARYVALLGAALQPPFSLSRREIQVPLVDPVDGEPTRGADAVARRSEGAVLCAPARDALTAAIAASGLPVVRLPPGIVSALFGETRETRETREAHEAQVLLAEVPSAGGSPDAALCAAATRVLASAGLPAWRVALGRVVGAPLGRPAALVPETSVGGSWLASPEELEARWRRPKKRGALLLALGDPLVEAARGRAAKGGRGPGVAAALLVRAILLDLPAEWRGEASRLARAAAGVLSADAPGKEGA